MESWQDGLLWAVKALDSFCRALYRLHLKFDCNILVQLSQPDNTKQGTRIIRAEAAALTKTAVYIYILIMVPTPAICETEKMTHKKNERNIEEMVRFLGWNWTSSFVEKPYTLDDKKMIRHELSLTGSIWVVGCVGILRRGRVIRSNISNSRSTSQLLWVCWIACCHSCCATEGNN